MQDIFVSWDGQQHGPYTEDQIQQLIAERQLVPTDLVWYEGLPNWEPAIDALADLMVQAPSLPPPIPVLDGRGRRVALADDVDDDIDLYDSAYQSAYPEEQRGLRWYLVRGPGKAILWLNYYFPRKGELWISARQRGNRTVEVFYSVLFWLAIIFLLLVVIFSPSR